MGDLQLWVKSAFGVADKDGRLADNRFSDPYVKGTITDEDTGTVLVDSDFLEKFEFELRKVTQGPPHRTL